MLVALCVSDLRQIKSKVNEELLVNTEEKRKAYHSESLARARLSVRHDCAVDAVHHVVHCVSGVQVVHRRLGSIVKHMIKAKLK